MKSHFFRIFRNPDWLTSTYDFSDDKEMYKLVIFRLNSNRVSYA
jgi:hypothetical protein